MLQDRVASCALDHYSNRISKGKPKDESEWTVYAAIVAQQSTKLWVVSCATGTKCTAIRKEGWALHDGHAEVLARRGLVRVLWLELRDKLQNEKPKENSLLGECENGQFQLRSDIQFHLYISDPPCGDASIYQVDTGSKEEILYTGAKVVVSKETGIDANACGGDHQLLEGTAVAREETQVLGKLRTKSGRSNLPVHLRSTSMSCSDKIVQWCVLGLQGGLLSKYVAPIQLSSVVVSRDPRLKDGKTSSEQQTALQRAIPDRIQAVWDYYMQKVEKSEDWNKPVPSVYIVSQLFSSGKAVMANKSPSILDVVKKDQTSHEDSKNSNKRKRSGTSETTISPCGFALNWQQSDPTVTEMIVGARGIRQGKKPKALEDYQRLTSRLSRSEFVRLHKSLEKDSSKESYQELKAKVCTKGWTELKSTILQEGPLAGWLRNRE
jgi:tRNA-specific adenosine deaminase 1